MSDLISDPLPRVSALIHAGVTTGLHIGAQIYVSINGQPVVNAAYGQSRVGIPMRPDTLILWQSSTKPISAVAIAQQYERGKLDLDDRVALHIPAFAAGGKEAITIRHILTHTGGFRGAMLVWTSDPWDDVISQICATRLETAWVPGEKAGYHLMGSWQILGEIVRRVDRRPFEQYVREEIFLPLGMNDSWLGMPVAEYRAYGDRIGYLHNTTGAVPQPSFPADTESGCSLCRPPSNGHGPIRELGFFYEMVLNKGERNGSRIVSAQTVDLFTSRHRIGMFDHTFKHTMDWCLGFIPDNNRYGVETIQYGYGPHCSAETVGHSGFQSSVGFADPAHGLAAAVLFNGCPGPEKHNVRMRQVAAVLYEDLGLAT